MMTVLTKAVASFILLCAASFFLQTKNTYNRNHKNSLVSYICDFPCVYSHKHRHQQCATVQFMTPVARHCLPSGLGQECGECAFVYVQACMCKSGEKVMSVKNDEEIVT